MTSLDPDSICRIFSYHVTTMAEFDAIVPLLSTLYNKNQGRLLSCLKYIFTSRLFPTTFSTVAEAREIFEANVLPKEVLQLLETQILHHSLPITRIHFKDGQGIYFEDMSVGDDVHLLVVSSMFLKYPPNFKISPSPTDEGTLEGFVGDQKTLETFFDTWEGFKQSIMDRVEIETRTFPVTKKSKMARVEPETLNFSVTPSDVKRLKLYLEQLE